MSKSRNSKLFTVGTTTIVDMETGEETPVEGGGLKMLPGPPGSCEWCHVHHDPDQPHNQQSMAYQLKFQTIHGRAPTWSDAMQHCSPEVRAFWREKLIEVMNENGVEIPPDLRDQ